MDRLSYDTVLWGFKVLLGDHQEPPNTKWPRALALKWNPKTKGERGGVEEEEPDRKKKKVEMKAKGSLKALGWLAGPVLLGLS